VTATASQAVGLSGALALALLTGEAVPGAAPLAWGVLAGLAGLVGVTALYRALADGTMGIASPIAALIGAALPALAGFVLGDRLAPAGAVGIVFGLAAIVAVALPGDVGGPGFDVRRTMPLVVVAGLGFAGFYLGIDQAVRAGGVTWWPLVAARAATVVASLVVVRRMRRSGGLGGSWRALAAVGVGDLMGNAFFVLANAQGAMSAAVVLSSLYPVTTVLLARVVLGERLRPVQAAGIVLALVGVVLIALPGA
jgi:drug/metabolite transporter (DMT)-like permease